MIYDIFLPFLIIFSIFSIIIILGKKIPQISLDNEASGGTEKPGGLTGLVCLCLATSEKILRQLRIHILKLDTRIFSLIEYLRKESAKKIDEVNKLSYKKIAKSAIENTAGGFTLKLQFKIEETKLLRTIAKNPKTAENYKKLGELYLKHKNFNDAKESFKEYLRLNPLDSEVKKMMDSATPFY